MGNPKGRIISCIATGSVILAYGAPSALAPPPPDPVAILPSDTDAAIGTGGAPWSPDDEHLVFAPAPAPAGADHGLVLFLPGCGNIPEQYEEFMLTAQGQGYHVIGLAFPNECGLNNSCGTDLFCPGKYRHEVTFGNLAGPAPLLDAHDSIRRSVTCAPTFTADPPWTRTTTRRRGSQCSERRDSVSEHRRRPLYSLREGRASVPA